MPWSVAFMVVAIVLITAIARTVSHGARLQHRTPDATPHVQSGDAARSQDEIRQLKERVKVLERVITENHGSADLSRQIDDLRDR